MRLEKFFVSWVSASLSELADSQAEAAAVELIHDVVAAISAPAKSRDSSYQMTILCADAQARYGDLDGARERYTKVTPKWDLDWPEGVFEAFANFENVHGSLETVVAARKVIGGAQKKLNRRREREAQIQQAQQVAYAQQQAEVVAATIGAEPAVTPGEPAAEPMAVDGVESAHAVAAVSQPAASEAAAPAAIVAVPATPAAPPAQQEQAGEEAQIKR